MLLYEVSMLVAETALVFDNRSTMRSVAPT